MPAPLPPPMVDFWRRLPDTLAGIPVLGRLAEALAPTDPAGRSYWPQGRERLAADLQLTGMSIPAQQWALDRVPVAYRPRSGPAAGTYRPPLLPPALSQPLAPLAYGPPLLFGEGVQMRGAPPPEILAHELLHADWFTRMSPQERRRFETDARDLAESTWQAATTDAAAVERLLADPALLQLVSYYYFALPQMRRAPFVAMPLSRLSPRLAELLPPAPTELYSYIGQHAAGAGSIDAIPPPLRPYYEDFFAVG